MTQLINNPWWNLPRCGVIKLMFIFTIFAKCVKFCNILKVQALLIRFINVAAISNVLNHLYLTIHYSHTSYSFIHYSHILFVLKNIYSYKYYLYLRISITIIYIIDIINRINSLTIKSLTQQEPINHHLENTPQAHLFLMIPTSGYFNSCVITSDLIIPTWNPSTIKGLHSPEVRPETKKGNRVFLYCWSILHTSVDNSSLNEKRSITFEQGWVRVDGRLTLQIEWVEFVGQFQEPGHVIINTTVSWIWHFCQFVMSVVDRSATPPKIKDNSPS